MCEAVFVIFQGLIERTASLGSTRWCLRVHNWTRYTDSSLIPSQNHWWTKCKTFIIYVLLRNPASWHSRRRYLMSTSKCCFRLTHHPVATVCNLCRIEVDQNTKVFNLSWTPDTDQSENVPDIPETSPMNHCLCAKSLGLLFAHSRRIAVQILIVSYTNHQSVDWQKNNQQSTIDFFRQLGGG